ncbi:MAG: type I DNA topoisomerase [Patescibacteria group bacterium]
MKKLVIVESPTKARTITKFLPKDYIVESSYGHVRDLPERELGVDVKNNFEPKYVIGERAEKQVAKLKSLAKNASEILFATDEDREGEAISWHLRTILNPKKFSRITFHEITPHAIEESLKHPRDIDLQMVDAQQARRVLDRLVGYELSPFLWRKVAKGLSAGRVQSVAVRLIVEREREIENFKPQEYWTIEGIFTNNHGEITANLHAKNGKTLKKLAIKNEAEAKKLLEEIKSKNFSITKIEQKEVKKKAPEPFKTSTLQQTANNRLNMSAKQIMKFAQELYEGIKIGARGNVGLITYMRTDSLNLSEQFLSSCHDYIEKNFGDKYSLKVAKKFKTKDKSAQEAHEAIRPTHVEYSPESIKQYLSPEQFKLYDLIWRRTVAGQMSEAVIATTTIDISSEKNELTFRANGQTIKFDGFLKVYPSATKENILPEFKEKEPVELKQLNEKKHETEPPARYTEASLIKIMEEYGIGRPSTYAPTIATIIDRKYIEKEEKKLKPTEIGKIVNDLLVEHFFQIVDYKFTAEMENSLDQIAEGKKKWQPVIEAFYTPFKKNLKIKEKELDKKKMEEKTDELCEKCGSEMVIKTGRYGRFVACSNYPKCKHTHPMPGEIAKATEELKLSDEKCPDCGAPLAFRRGRFGPFLGCSKYPDCKFIKKEKIETGVKCPQCHEGDIIGRKGRRGSFFYACNGYPKCKFILSDKPTGAKCSICESLMVEKDSKIFCSNKECKSQSS